MTKEELKQAVTIAKSSIVLNRDISIFNGFALRDFKPLVVTIDDIAALVRWQAVCILTGELDTEALNEIAQYGRNRFLVVG